MNAIKYHTNLLMLYACMLALPVMSFGQARSKKATVDLLCHQWVSNFAKSPKKMDCFPPDTSSTIRFLPNGYIVFSEKKGPEGVWNYDAARNNLYIIVNGTLWKYKIIALTVTELAVESTSGKNPTVWYLLRSNQ